jgi:hypothetical protein
MKRIVYIGFVIIGLTFVSCQKEDVRPNSDRSLDAPAWDCGGTEKSSEDGYRDGDGGRPTFDPGGDGIVDPGSEDENNKTAN